MTEKRFKLAYEKGNWWAVRDGDITLWKEEVIHLLNELSDENEQLRKENDMFSCELSVSANKEISRNCRIAELEEENEQLRQENEKLQGKYDYLLWLYNGLGCEYDWLKEENEQLKKKNKRSYYIL